MADVSLSTLPTATATVTATATPATGVETMAEGTTLFASLLTTLADPAMLANIPMALPPARAVAIATSATPPMPTSDASATVLATIPDIATADSDDATAEPAKANPDTTLAPDLSAFLALMAPPPQIAPLPVRTSAITLLTTKTGSSTATVSLGANTPPVPTIPMNVAAAATKGDVPVATTPSNIPGEQIQADSATPIAPERIAEAFTAARAMAAIVPTPQAAPQATVAPQPAIVPATIARDSRSDAPAAPPSTPVTVPVAAPVAKADATPAAPLPTPVTALVTAPVATTDATPAAPLPTPITALVTAPVATTDATPAAPPPTPVTALVTAPIATKDAMPAVPPVVTTDATPAAAPPIVTKDATPVTVPPVVTKDATSAAAPPVVTKDATPVAMRPVGTTDATPVAAPPVVTTQPVQLAATMPDTGPAPRTPETVVAPTIVPAARGADPAPVAAAAIAAAPSETPRAAPARLRKAEDTARLGEVLAEVAPARIDIASAAAAAAPPPADDPVARQLSIAQDGQWLDSLARDIAGAGNANGQLNFRLDPDHLGSLTVQIAQGADGASIRLTASTEAARTILADAQPRLVAEARAQGLTLRDATIETRTAAHTPMAPTPTSSSASFGGSNGSRSDQGGVAAQLQQQSQQQQGGSRQRAPDQPRQANPAPRAPASPRSGADLYA